jgi:hypothetical protein
MILECTLDELVKKIRRQDLVDVGAVKVTRERLIR